MPKDNLLCPVCGRELAGSPRLPEGWQCRCGEFVPESMAVNPFGGCTHGLACNCGREMRR